MSKYNNIKPDYIIASLETNKRVFEQLFSGLEEVQYVFKPEPSKWCILEVLCHLCDEEVEDFRMRVRHVLEQRSGPPPSINPPAWVNERRYMEQDFGERCAKFASERDESIRWLTSLTDPDWDSVYQHPKLGPLSARLFLHNWLAHDYIHIRQINRLRFEFLRYKGKISLDYAGSW